MRAFDEHKPTAVIHFAALSLVGESTRDPGRYYDVNVGGTLRLLEAMRAASVSRLVFSSTCAVYGEPAKVPIDENTPHAPVSPYGNSKRCCEDMIADFGQAHGIRSARLRYFNASGADRNAVIGEWHDPETHLIPLIIDAALGRRPEIQIFGTDYPTPDGTAIRDYIHVTDLAAAHVAALRYLMADGESVAVNVGTGQGASVAEVIRTVETVSGRRVPAREVGRRAGDPAGLVADPAKAHALLGWQAQADLHKIVRDAWEWHRRLNS